MPRLNEDIVSIRIPDKHWLTDEERRIIDEVDSSIAAEFTSDSRESKTYSWLVAELCHLREKVSNLGWQLYPDQMGK
jgi:hypothetical protein